MYNSNRGFVALISVVLISAILLIVIVTLGLSTFFQRFDTLDTENKRVSLGYAEGCVNAAMLRIAQNAAYAGGEYCSLNSTCSSSMSASLRVCEICQVTYPSGKAQILARAAVNGAYSNLTVTVNPTPGNFTVLGWSENPTYSGPTCTVP